MRSNKNLEKSEVREYFNGTGFDRWRKIYSKSEEINTVQKNIRKGHQKTVDDVVSYVKNYPELTSKTFCDAGCGVGSLAIPLAQMGKHRRCSPVTSGKPAEKVTREIVYNKFFLLPLCFVTF